MKRTYTKKQIQEAISCWKKQLGALNEAEAAKGSESYLGEWNAAEHGQPGEFTVVFGPYDEQTFQSVLSEYPQTAIDALVGGKPYRYKQLAGSDYKGVRVFGNASAAKQAFKDVCRQYKLFAFPETTDIRWTQLRPRHECFFQWANGNTPSDMWDMMSRGRDGKDFICFFYSRCRQEYRRAVAENGNINIYPIWDRAVPPGPPQRTNDFLNLRLNRLRRGKYLLPGKVNESAGKNVVSLEGDEKYYGPSMGTYRMTLKKNGRVVDQYEWECFLFNQANADGIGDALRQFADGDPDFAEVYDDALESDVGSMDESWTSDDGVFEVEITPETVRWEDFPDGWNAPMDSVELDDFQMQDVRRQAD